MAGSRQFCRVGFPPTPNSYRYPKMAVKKFLALAACILLSSAQPVLKAPVLRDTALEVLFKDGEPAVLECVVDGGQNVKYSWRKDGKPFTPQSSALQRKDEGTLEFQKPTSSDEGFYICNAETNQGVTMTRGTNLKRAFITKPKVTVKKHSAVQGRPFKLDCSAPDAYPQPEISWKTQIEGAQAEKYLNRRVTPSPDGTLWFSNVTAEDANPKMKYICVAKSLVFEEVTLAEHYIDRLEEDSTPNNGDLVPQYLSDNMFAKVGDVTSIWCIYGGTPLAHPDWFKDGKNVNGKPSDRVTRHNRTSGRRLLIKSTELGDQGTYKCVANNEVGKPAEHSMTLTVYSSPSFSKKPEKQTLVKEGQDITIPCQVSGVPTPSATFVRNGEKLSTNDRISTGPEGISIKKVEKSDAGYYGCRVVSQHGFDYLETLLQVA